MRTLLIAALAISTFSSPAAEACGDYRFRPRVFLLSSHGVKTTTGWQTRTFAVLGNDAPADAKWRALAPRTYDHSRIANAPALEHDVQLTLVGPGGTRIVTSRSRWFLDSAWRFGKPSIVVEVSTGDKQLTIALAGRHADAVWIAHDDLATTRIARLDGHVLGGISVQGERFALVERDGIVTPVAI
jgi:hypothetical protein